MTDIPHVCLLSQRKLGAVWVVHGFAFPPLPFTHGVQVPAERPQTLDVCQSELSDGDHCVALLQAELVAQALDSAVTLRH